MLFGKVSKSDLLAIGLIGKLIEHCTDIADVIGLNLIQTLIFSQASIANGVTCVYNYDDDVIYTLVSNKQLKKKISNIPS